MDVRRIRLSPEQPVLVQAESQADEPQATLPSHSKLARDAKFQAFVLRSTLRVLQKQYSAENVEGTACCSGPTQLP